MRADEGRMATKQLLRDAITARSARDTQKSVGPSDLSQKCDFCLGLKMTRKYPELRPAGYELADRFGLKAWMGTGAHTQMDTGFARLIEHHDTERGDPVLTVEGRFFIHELEGYGPIHGHVDVVVHYVDEYLAVVDTKTTDKAKLKKYKLHGIPDPYAFQTNTYGWGVEQALGVAPDDVGINFIPRDSNNLEDTWQCFAPYNRAIAEMALERAERVWAIVRDGGLFSLEQDPECWDCGSRYGV